MEIPFKNKVIGDVIILHINKISELIEHLEYTKSEVKQNVTFV